MTKITVKDTEVNVVKVNGEDYICLTDMLRAKDGDFFITDWLRNRNTLEFIGIPNPDTRTVKVAKRLGQEFMWKYSGVREGSLWKKAQTRVR